MSQELVTSKEALVILIDDDHSDLNLLSLFVEKIGFDYLPLKDPEGAIAALNREYKNRPVVVISDIQMPSLDGFALLRRVKDQFPETPFIFTSGSNDFEVPIQALRLGAYDYLRKPVALSELQIRLERAVERTQDRFQLNRLEHEILSGYSAEGFIGKSHLMIEIFRKINKIAMVDSPVLVNGESGVGKEKVAHAIHDRGPRAEFEFVAVNCASIPETLLEAELFGFMKGSFTGADKDSPGLFEVANHGTLFLDEIGEMPMSLQAKLLRVLQEGEIKPIGAKKSKKLNVRIISATHQNLRKMIDEKKFREDLYFRLNVIPLEIPPLRNRKEDMETLISYFLRKMNTRWGHAKTLDREGKIKLLNHDWPGNIRELENTLERAYVLSDSPILLASDFDFSRRNGESAYAAAGGPLFHLPPGANLPTLEQVESSYIREVLQRTSSKDEASKVLGIGRKTLYRKERDHGLDL